MWDSWSLIIKYNNHQVYTKFLIKSKFSESISIIFPSTEWTSNPKQSKYIVWFIAIIQGKFIDIDCERNLFNYSFFASKCQLVINKIRDMRIWHLYILTSNKKQSHPKKSKTRDLRDL